MKAQLVLENGKRFFGEMFGAQKDVVGEVIFTTGMIGYQETVTDAAFAGQIVTMTFPVIGNYGINFEDSKKSTKNATAIIVREVCDKPSNFRSEMTLSSFLKQQNVVGLSGIDTRALTKMLRNEGTMKGVIVSADATDEEIKKLFEEYNDSDLILKTTVREEYTKNPDGEKHAVLIDMGAKAELEDELAELGFKVSIVSADAKAEKILGMNPDLMVISNGPANPENAPGTVESVATLVGKLPIFGVCMGCQILALALGGKCEKMKFGHHGANQPVKDAENGQVYITSQTHSYVVSELPQGVDAAYKNVNDGSVEGIFDKKNNALGVQFRPGEQLEEMLDRILGEVK